MDPDAQTIADGLIRLESMCARLSTCFQHVAVESTEFREVSSKLVAAVAAVWKSLSAVQHSIILDLDEFSLRMESLSQFKATFETTIKACISMLTFLENEGKSIKKSLSSDSAEILSWDWSAATAILERLGDQKRALSVVSMAIQAGTLKEIRGVLVDNKSFIDNIFERTQTSLIPLYSSPNDKVSSKALQALNKQTSDLAILDQNDPPKEDLTHSGSETSGTITSADTLVDPSVDDRLRNRPQTLLSESHNSGQNSGKHHEKSLDNISSASKADATRIKMLIEVIETQNEARIEELLVENVGSELDIRGTDGFTPLIVATKLNLISAVTRLLEFGASVDFQDGKLKSTALQWAAEKGHTEITKLLLELGANIHLRNDLRRNAVDYAGQMGSKEAIEMLIQHGSEPNSKDEQGISVIQYAASYGFCSTIELLVNKGANIQATTPDGRNALHVALQFGQLAASRLLIHHGVPLETKDEKHRTPLHFAVLFADANAVELLLQNRVHVDSAGPDDFTPLHEAASGGKVDCITILLNNLASIEKRTSTGRTALHIAAVTNQTDAASMLLSRGANFRAVDDNGCIPLHLAVRISSLEMTKLLIQAGTPVDEPCRFEENKHTALHGAALQGDRDIVKYLLDNRASINSRMCTEEQTPLHCAARQGQLAVVEDLIQRGASIHSRTQELDTLLHSSAYAGHLATMELFLSKGLSVHDKDKSLQTPLHIAAAAGRAEAIRLLLKRGADASAKDNEGQVALHRAANVGSIECIDVLLTVGKSSVKVKDDGWNMPLHHASWSGHVSALEFLVRNKAPVDVVSKSDQTPLMGAAGFGHVEALKFLLSKGAKIEAKFGTESTALCYAVLGNHKAAVEYLLEQGAKTDVVGGSDGETILHFAALEPATDGEIAELILDHGADIDARSVNGGHTPLMNAAISGNLDVASVLLERGAQLELKSDTTSTAAGNTALAFTLRSTHLKATELLLQRGANVHEPVNDRDYRPIHYAARYCSAETVRLLLKYGASAKSMSSDGALPRDLAEDESIRALLSVE